MKILIADDDFVSRAILSKALKGRGKCEFASTGPEVWQAYLGGIPLRPHHPGHPDARHERT